MGSILWWIKYFIKSYHIGHLKTLVQYQVQQSYWILSTSSSIVMEKSGFKRCF